MNEMVLGSRVYVDANVIIYFVEFNPQFTKKANDMFANVDRVGAFLLTNEITIAECLYRPAKHGDRKALLAYERFFNSGEIEITPLDGSLARRAALNGGGLALKLIDAIHYFAAIETHCDFFATADGMFKSSPEMEILRIS